MSVFVGVIDHESIKKLAKLKNLTYLNLKAVSTGSKNIKIMAESLRKTNIIFGPDHSTYACCFFDEINSSVFYNYLRKAWGQNGDNDILRPELTEELCLKLA